MATQSQTSFSLDDENIRFFRLASILIDVGTDVLRNVLHREHPEKTFNQALQNNQARLTSLHRKKILNDQQRDMLFPVTGAADSSTFDISLLFILLRNICPNIVPKPPSGWKGLPANTDVSVGADILRLKEIRNVVVAHASKTKISLCEYNTEVTNLKSVMHRLCQLVSNDFDSSTTTNIKKIEDHPLDCQSYLKVSNAVPCWYLEDLKTLIVYDKKDISNNLQEILESMKAVLQAVNSSSYLSVLLTALKDAEKVQLNNEEKLDKLMKLAYLNSEYVPCLRLGLQKWTKQLRKNVIVGRLLPKLLEGGVLNREDLKLVESEDGQGEQVDRMIFIMTSKNDECVLKFCRCLRELHPKLADLVENVADDGHMTEEILKSIENENIRLILDVYFEEDTTSTTSAEILHATVARKLGGCQIEFERLKCMVAEAFKGSKYEKKDEVYVFTGLLRKEKDEDAFEMPETNVRQKPRLQDISIKMLHEILANRLKHTGIDPGKLLEVLTEEDITGEVFLQLQTDVMLTFFKRHFKVTLGIQTILSKIQRELSEENMRYEGEDASAKWQETFRKFAQPASDTDVYKRGGVLTSSVSGSYNLIDPVHRFMAPPKRFSVNQEQWLSKEMVKFAAACLNSRTNGTIHFGVEMSDEGDECRGEIKGIRVSNVDNVRKEFSSSLEKCFNKEQFGIVRKCIGNPQFIPVVDEDLKKMLFVVEVDVEPMSIYTKTELFAIMFPPYGPFKRSVFAYDSSLIKLIELDSDMEKQLLEEIKELAETRKQREDRAIQYTNSESDLGFHLRRLVTKGNKYISDELFPVLFVGPLAKNMDMKFLEKNLDFVVDMLGSLKAVFHFDGGDQLLHFVESKDGCPCFVLEPRNFDRHCIDDVQENLASGSKMPWIFCNGYKDADSPVLKIGEWNQERREGVQEAIRLLSHEIIPDGRAVIIFLLFEKTDDRETGDPMLEAAEEVFLKFKNQWIVVAENPGVAEKWKISLCQRKKVPKNVIAERFIVGLQWGNFNEIMKTVIKERKLETCILPASFGECTMTAKDKIDKELDDLEILSCRQFVEEKSSMSADDLNTRKEDVEEEFYRGALVSWWNFLFEDQVVERWIFPRLLDNIRSKLKPKDFDEDQLVQTEILKHHAGAGGSTLARHVLWHFSQIRPDAADPKYRCCVIKKITKQTASQIEKFRRFKDDKANRPVIALLDNESDEKISDLLQKLHYLANKSENAGGLFCLLLIVKRASISVEKKVSSSSDIVLTHQLSEEEIAWFDKKTKSLENYERHYDSGKIKLENLIAFNLMKQQFKKSYIKDIAARFYEDIHDDTEKCFLKCLAFINSYDMLFQPVPSSVFDHMMTALPAGHIPLEQLIRSPAIGLTVPPRKKFLPCKEEYTWNVTASKALQTLLIKKSPEGQGYTTGGLSIISQALAKELLERIMTNSEQSLYDVAMEVLKVVEQHVCERNFCSKSFVEIVNSLFKNRWWSEDGHRREFSELVLALNDLEDGGDKKVIQLMKKCFECTEDPMMAQQLARFLYIKCRNWTEAETVIKQAIEKKKSSYLLDTYGQILKSKMDIINEAEELINLAFDAIDKFKNGQTVCRTFEDEHNNSVFYGEINTGLDLLEKFHKITCHNPGKVDFHRFLVDPAFIPLEFQSMDQTKFLRLKKEDLYKNLNISLRVLEETKYQVKEKRYTSTIDMQASDQLESLRKRLERYYCTDKSLTNHARYLYGYGLDSIMKLKERNETIFLETHNKAKSKLTSLANDSEPDSKDLLIALGATLASLSNCLKELCVDYRIVLKWSEKLYGLSFTGNRPYMEAFLYLIIFHWPTRARSSLPLCHLDKLNNALNEMKVVYDRNHNVQPQKENYHRRIPAKTFFFLGKGDPGEDIVHYKKIHGKTQARGDEVWSTPEARERLQRLDGFLCYGGKAVDYEISHNGLKRKINIRTSLPYNARLWQRPVSFLLGFSWSGPIAYDVLKVQQQFEENQSNQSVQNDGNQEADIEIGNQQTPALQPSSSAVHKEMEESKGACGYTALDEHVVTDKGEKTFGPAQTKKGNRGNKKRQQKRKKQAKESAFFK